jgi:hypothetical protein
MAFTAAALGLRKLRGRAVELPLSVLLGPIGDLRAHLYASTYQAAKQICGGYKGNGGSEVANMAVWHPLPPDVQSMRVA